MDKIKGEGKGGGGRWVQLGWGGGMGRKGIQLYLNNNKIFLKKEHIFLCSTDLIECPLIRLHIFVLAPLYWNITVYTFLDSYC